MRRRRRRPLRVRPGNPHFIDIDPHPHQKIVPFPRDHTPYDHPGAEFCVNSRLYTVPAVWNLQLPQTI